MRARRLGPPLSAQILLLLLGGLVMAQLATLALTVLWPPSAPAQYRLEDIAAALGGARAPVRGGRPLERRVLAEPPSLRSAGWMVSERSRHDLARLTGAAEADVRLLFYSPLPFAGAGGGGLADADGPAGGRRVDLAVMGDDGPVRVAYLQGGGFGGGVGGPGPRGSDRVGFGPDGSGRLGSAPQDGGDIQARSRAGGRGVGASGGGRRGGGGPHGPAGAAGTADAPVAAAPTTIDPPGSHDGAWLSLRDVAGAGAGRLGAPAGGGGVGARLVGEPGRGAALAPTPGAGAAAAHRLPSPATGALVRPGGLLGGFAPVFPPSVAALDVPASAAGRTARPDAELPPAPTAPRPARAQAAPAAPQALPQPAPPQPTPADIDVAAEVAEQGVIAPASLVAARSGEHGGYVVRAPDLAPRGLFGLAPAPFVQGDFVAAVRIGPGRWATVRPTPEPFPNSWQRRVLLWFALAFALTAPAGWLFARGLARPLREFAAAAERLGRDPSGRAAPLSGPAEIGRAAAAFSIMQARLKRFVDDRTAMVGAISHDLRTPLARMRFRMERAPPALREGMLHDIGQMEEMISSVLVFIRDASEPSIRERVDLRSILECVVDDAALVGGEAVLDAGAPMSVEVDALGVQRVLTNLVDNALKYGSRAAVRMYAEGGEAVAEVVDDGPGLPVEELERVFLPFYRSQGARTLNTGGIGLGLAVSRSIARAHGGDVRLLGAEGRGMRAQLRLPLAVAASG